MRRSIRNLSVAAAVCLVLAACGAAPGSSPLTSLSAAPSPIPSTEPSTTPATTPAASVEPSASVPGDSVPIPSDTYARVATDDLRVRSKPGVSDDSKKLGPLLQEGTLVLVVDGPVQASGYDWYQVQPLLRSDLQEEVDPFGWVAMAGKDGEPWLVPEAIPCPPAPNDYDELSNLSPIAENYYGITCFSGREFTFKARLGAPETLCGTEPGWGVDPAWFDNCGQPLNYLVTVDGDGGIATAWLPDVDLSIAPEWDDPIDQWPIVEVTGMYDHASAQNCRNRQNNPEAGPIEPDAALTRLNCRSRFVVTSMREVDG